MYIYAIHKRVFNWSSKCTIVTSWGSIDEVVGLPVVGGASVELSIYSLCEL